MTPSFNQGRFLEKTIKSVLNQNCDDLEYIVIDGGSTDETVGILKRHKQDLAYCVSEKDRGQTHAINKGLEKATGDIIGYLNSDDILLPGTLEYIREVFGRDEADIVYGDCLIIDENNGVLKEKREVEFDHTMGCMIGFGLIIIQPSAFFRRKVMDKVGFFEESMHFAMDEDYWFRCVCHGMKFKHVRHPLSAFRWHGVSKSKTTDRLIVERRNLEKRMVRRKAYNTLAVSKFIPFGVSLPLRKIYRAKRVFQKLMGGCYNKKGINLDIKSWI